MKSVVSNCMKVTCNICSGPEGYYFSSVGVVFDVSQPFIYFNMTVSVDHFF